MRPRAVKRLHHEADLKGKKNVSNECSCKNGQILPGPLRCALPERIGKFGPMGMTIFVVLHRYARYFQGSLPYRTPSYEAGITQSARSHSKRNRKRTAKSEGRTSINFDHIERAPKFVSIKWRPQLPRSMPLPWKSG